MQQQEKPKALKNKNVSYLVVQSMNRHLSKHKNENRALIKKFMI